jgi:antitoxin (DNA-binding transcriptional repressor) of toxin-antitoxin stability system
MESTMQTIQVAELKSHFSEVLKTIKDSGEKFIIEYGKQHEKVAVLVPYDKNLELEAEREFGLYKGKGSFVLKDDFEMTDQELLGL